jgi:peptidoglycan/LPS O-acetylase OafA/YrhL
MVTTRYSVLDGWRGVCALVVALHHLQADGHFFALPFLRNAWLFVDFFFVLSGFVLAHAYGGLTAGGFVRFAWRRLGRIWPLHVCVLAAFVVLEAIKLALMAVLGIAADNPPFSGETSATALVSNVMLVHAWGLHDIATWNFPSWSISTEWGAYLVFGAVAALGLAGRPVVAAALALGGGLMVAVASPEGLHTIADFGLFRCLYGFFTGVLVYRLVAGARASRPLSSLAEVAVVAVVAGFVTIAEKGPNSLAAPLVFGLAVAVFAGEGGRLSRLLAAAPAQALGRYSYSIYLVHTLVLVAMGRAISLIEAKAGWVLTAPLEVNGAVRVLLLPNQPWAADVVAVLFLAVVVALSAQTHRWIEQPGQRLFARLARRFGGSA